MKLKATKELLDAILKESPETPNPYVKDGYLGFNCIRIEDDPQRNYNIQLLQDGVPLAKVEGVWDEGASIDLRIHDGKMRIFLESA